MRVIDELKRDIIFARSTRLVLSLLQETDYKRFIEISRAVSKTPEIYEIQDFCDVLWQQTYSSECDVWFLATTIKDGLIVGDGVLKLRRDNIIELGYDVDPFYQNRGIGTEIMMMMSKEIRMRYPEIKMVARVASDNAASVRVMEKLKATMVGEEKNTYDSLMHLVSNSLNEFGTDISDEAKSLLGQTYVNVYEL